MNRQFRHRTSSKNKKNSDWKNRIWSSNIFSVLLIVLLIVSFIKVSKEIMLRYEIKREINTLETELEDLQSKTYKMDQLISYLKTDEYIEKQARSQLNLSKPGEKQINLFKTDVVDGIGEQNENLPNMNKWFNYFFK